MIEQQPTSPPVPPNCDRFAKVSDLKGRGSLSFNANEGMMDDPIFLLSASRLDDRGEVKQGTWMLFAALTPLERADCAGIAVMAWMKERDRLRQEMEEARHFGTDAYVLEEFGATIKKAAANMTAWADGTWKP